jgi:hypothetical protein
MSLVPGCPGSHQIIDIATQPVANSDDFGDFSDDLGLDVFEVCDGLLPSAIELGIDEADDFHVCHDRLRRSLGIWAYSRRGFLSIGKSLFHVKPTIKLIVLRRGVIGVTVSLLPSTNRNQRHLVSSEFLVYDAHDAMTACPYIPPPPPAL